MWRSCAVHEANPLFFFQGNIAAVLPTYLSQWVTKKVKALGVNVHPQASVTLATMAGAWGGECLGFCCGTLLIYLFIFRIITAFAPDDKVKLELSDGSVIMTDHVLVAVGLQPNTELAEQVGSGARGSSMKRLTHHSTFCSPPQAGLEICKERGGILVNAELEARRDVWVVCCVKAPPGGGRWKGQRPA